MKNNTGLSRAERKAKRRAKVADRLATLPRYWVFMRKPGSPYTKLVAHDVGVNKAKQFVMVKGIVMERAIVYEVTKV